MNLITANKGLIGVAVRHSFNAVKPSGAKCLLDKRGDGMDETMESWELRPKKFVKPS